MTLRRWGIFAVKSHTAQGFFLVSWLDMLHRSTQQHQCSHPACYMLPEPPLLAYYLQQPAHTLIRNSHSCPFTPQQLTDGRGHSLSPRTSPSHVHMHMHRACPHTLLPTVIHVMDTHSRSVPTPFPGAFSQTHSGCLP